MSATHFVTGGGAKSSHTLVCVRGQGNNCVESSTDGKERRRGNHTGSNREPRERVDSLEALPPYRDRPPKWRRRAGRPSYWSCSRSFSGSGMGESSRDSFLATLWLRWKEKDKTSGIRCTKQAHLFESVSGRHQSQPLQFKMDPTWRSIFQREPLRTREHNETTLHNLTKDQNYCRCINVTCLLLFFKFATVELRVYLRM